MRGDWIVRNSLLRRSPCLYHNTDIYIVIVEFVPAMILCSCTNISIIPQVHTLKSRRTSPHATLPKERVGIDSGAHTTQMSTAGKIQTNVHGDSAYTLDVRATKKREKEKHQKMDFKTWRHEEEKRQADLAAKALEEEKRQADLAAKALEEEKRQEDLAAKALEEEKRQADLAAERLEEETRQAKLRAAKKREAELDQQQHRAALEGDNFQLKPSLANSHGGHDQFSVPVAATSTPQLGKYHHEQTLADFFEDVGDSDNAGRTAIHALLDEYEGNLQELEQKLFVKFGQAPSLSRPPNLPSPELESEESDHQLQPKKLFESSPTNSASPSPEPEPEDPDRPPLLSQSGEADVPHALVAIRETARTLADSAKDISSMNASIVYMGNPYDSADRVGYAECDADTVRIDPQLYRWTRLLRRIEALLQQSSDLRNMLYTSRSCSKAMPQVACLCCLCEHNMRACAGFVTHSATRIGLFAGGQGQ